jgi:hypothetical protein
VVLAIPAITSGATTERFEDMSGARSRQGREFVVGDGLRIVFHDRTRAHTRYSVCWKGPHHRRAVAHWWFENGLGD